MQTRRHQTPVSNGFVDLQVNGFQGRNFSDPALTLADIEHVTRELVVRGTIAYCPTIITSSMGVYQRNLPLLADAMQQPEWGRHILGTHLEGPYIAGISGAVGAHPPEFVRKPAVTEFRQLQRWSHDTIRLLTVAPGLAGVVPVIRTAVRHGVAVSLGHHWSSDAEMAAAVAAGATLCTHLGNGIPNEIPRHDNPLWWQLACDDLTAMCITDGHHLPADFIKVLVRSKNPRRVIVTSDAAVIAGLRAGRYPDVVGRIMILRESGRIELPASRSLAGSSATMLDCLNHLADQNLMTERQLWQVGRDNPLRAIGFTRRRLRGLRGPTVRFTRSRFVVRPSGRLRARR
ncbi:MAG: N-acetylglucosamine-6-phosphate deacetylase [Lentisphaerae bacterium]|nr:N-acetylglucosamine-6-phosphate deacetylase [Lentisphaerota bacterium]